MRVVAANRAHGPHCYVSSANTEENHVLSDGDVEARRVLPGVEHADAARRVVIRRNRGACFLWRRVDKVLLRSKPIARGSKRVQIRVAPPCCHCGTCTCPWPRCARPPPTAEGAVLVLRCGIVGPCYPVRIRPHSRRTHGMTEVVCVIIQPRATAQRTAPICSPAGTSTLQTRDKSAKTV